MTTEFRVLGPVDVLAEGNPVSAGEPRRRAVLAALLIDAGFVVSSSTLVARVWGDDPPDQAHRTLATYVTRLRRVLESAGGDDPPRVVNQSGGYRLVIDRDLVDLHRFRRLVATARDPGRSDEERVALLRRAVAHWHGEPLAGIPGDWAHRTRDRLVRERLDATAAWAEAELRTGNLAPVLAQLAELAGEHPTMEPLTAALMRALVAAGRPSEALEYGRAHRRRLADEHGTDQGPELRTLYEAILRGELGPAATAATAGWAAVPVPAQLPADVPGFAGRAADLARLDALLPDADASPPAMVISAMSGTAGVGKTTLAVHWAHRITDRFPDGQLFVNLRGFDPTGKEMDPTEALRRFLEALNVPTQRIPTDPEARSALYRSLLAGRRTLVVLDNARDSAQVRPLLPGASGCLVLVTSRNQLTSLIADGAHSIVVDLLTADGAHDLLAQRLGDARVSAEPDAVAEIIASCARLPLALALVAAHAAVRPRASLHVLAQELRDAQSRWHTLAGDDPVADLRAVFSWSYQSLTTESARLFRLLGLHPGPDLTAAAAASLAALSQARSRSLLAELAQASLLTEHLPGRYSCHDLLRAYATHLAGTTDPAQQRHAATHRMLDHYLHTGYAADRWLYSSRDPIVIGPAQPGVTPEHHSDRAAAVDWFGTERPVLLAAIDSAAATGFDTHAWQLAWTLWTFLDWRGHWHDQADVGRVAVAAARRLADPNAQAIAHRTLGHAYTLLGRLDEAHTQLSEAADLCRQAGDQVGLARTLGSLAYVWDLRHEPRQALVHSRQALELYRAVGHQQGRARALSDIGWCSVLIGEYEQALTACQEALPLLRALGDRHGEAGAWDSLGYAHHHLGRYSEAATCYQRARTLFREVGDRFYEAEILTHLGDTHRATGSLGAARDAWQQALAILDDLEHPNAQNVRAMLHALDQHSDSPSHLET